MKSNNPFLETADKEDQQQHDAQQQNSQESIDVTDAEENHSTAAEGGELVEKDSTTEKVADTSEGNLPDPETLSDNEDGEYDRGKISEK